MEETDIGHRSICKYFDVPVIWVEDIRLLPHGKSKPQKLGWKSGNVTNTYDCQRKERLPSFSHMNSSTHFP